ncbi:MAG: hypothetical protein AB9869_19400 [Verrucomicrobiia bacterium]
MHYVQNVQKLQKPVSGCHVQYVQKHTMFLDMLDMGGETTVLDMVRTFGPFTRIHNESKESNPWREATPQLSTILGQLDTLTDTQRVRYQACEAVVAAGWQSFVDVGLALAEIRWDRLYKEEYDSFEVYCRVKWHDGRRNVYQLISAAELFTHLCAISLYKYS